MEINVWTVRGNKWTETESLTREVARNSEKQKSAKKQKDKASIQPNDFCWRFDSSANNILALYPIITGSILMRTIFGILTNLTKHSKSGGYDS